MKKPILKNYNDKVLLLLSERKNDEDFDNRVRNILFERYSKQNMSYFRVYAMYMLSNGIKHLVYGDLLATHLIEGGYSVNKEVLNELLPTLSVDQVWCLSNSSDDLVKEVSREHLFTILDFYDEKRVIEENFENKVLKKANVIFFNRKEEKR